MRLGCHSPPISDSELISIIRAFNDARARNSDATLNWKCGACRKVKQNPVDPAPSTKDDPIVVDDDDEVVELIHPPVKRQESSKPTGIVASHSEKYTPAKIAQPVRIIDDPIDFLISPSVQRSRSSTLTSGIGHLSVSDNQHGLREPTYDPTPPPISELHSERTSTPSHPHEYPQALKTSENQQSPLPISSEARPGSAHRGSDVQSSSLTVAPALSPSLDSIEASRTSPGTKERPFLERWSMVTVQLRRSDHPPPSRPPAPLFHPALLPHYINSQYRNSTGESESDKKTDAWYLATLRKSKVQDAGSGQAQSTEASDPAHRRRNKKKRAVHHEVVHGMGPPPNTDDQHVSKAPFYFSVNTWMKENEDALALFETIA